jgi:hypothetical protein
MGNLAKSSGLAAAYFECQQNTVKPAPASFVNTVVLTDSVHNAFAFHSLLIDRKNESCR